MGIISGAICALEGGKGAGVADGVVGGGIAFSILAASPEGDGKGDGLRVAIGNSVAAMKPSRGDDVGDDN